MGCHLLASTVAASRPMVIQQIQNTILALRTAERRTGSSMTVTVPPERRPVRPPRLDLDMVQPPPHRGFVLGRRDQGGCVA